MKIKIVSYYAGDDPLYAKMCSLTKEINSKYCQLHNYAYQFNKKDMQEIKNFAQSNHGNGFDIIAYKIKFLYEHLIKNDCDILVFLDADATVSNPNIKIEDLIDNKHDFFISSFDDKNELEKQFALLSQKLNYYWSNKNTLDQYPAYKIIEMLDLYRHGAALSTGSLFWNEGLIIIKNTPTIQEFFKEAMLLVPYFHNLKNPVLSTEQRVLGFLCLQTKYKDIYTYLTPYAQGGYAAKFEAKYDENKSFVLHDYLISDRNVRIKNIQQLKQNKWWKDIFK